MNLVAKAFLYGSQDDLDTLLDANTSEVGAEDGKDREKEVVNFWRKRGSLGKLKPQRIMQCRMTCLNTSLLNSNCPDVCFIASSPDADLVLLIPWAN